MVNIGGKINTYFKAVGLSTLIGFSSCSKEVSKVAPDCFSSTKQLIGMLERGDRHAIRLTDVPNNVRVLTKDEISKYAQNDSVGDLFYKVYVGKGDSAIRLKKGKKNTLVTVGDGLTGINFIKLAGSQKAYKDDYVSAVSVDSLTDLVVRQNDSILRRNVGDSIYDNLKQHEKDAVIAYLYNVGEKLLSKPKSGKSFFNFLTEGKLGQVQAKFNVKPSADEASVGLAKRNLVQLLVFGNGNVYQDKACMTNFKKQLDIVKSSKNSKSLLKEVVDIVKKCGVDTTNIKKTEENFFNINN